MLNRQIRATIMQYLIRGNIIDTRIFIDYLARKYNTPKQRICGNLSFMKRSGAIRIYSSRPYSVAYY